jgi:hypothetical protein
MRRIFQRTNLLLSTTCLSLAIITLPAAGVQSGTVDTGVRYAMGGVGVEERSELRALRDEYNLWISTATRNGSYLSGVMLRVVDQRSGDVMLQGTLNGPWLFADLPPGDYAVHATTPDGASLTRQVQLDGDSAQRTTLLSF